MGGLPRNVSWRLLTLAIQSRNSCGKLCNRQLSTTYFNAAICGKQRSLTKIAIMSASARHEQCSLCQAIPGQERRRLYFVMVTVAWFKYSPLLPTAGEVGTMPKEPPLFSSGQALLISFVQFLPNAYIRDSRCGHAHNAIAERVRSGTNDASRRRPGGVRKIGNHRGRIVCPGPELNRYVHFWTRGF